MIPEPGLAFAGGVTADARTGSRRHAGTGPDCRPPDRLVGTVDERSGQHSRGPRPRASEVNRGTPRGCCCQLAGIFDAGDAGGGACRGIRGRAPRRNADPLLGPEPDLMPAMPDLPPVKSSAKPVAAHAGRSSAGRAGTGAGACWRTRRPTRGPAEPPAIGPGAAGTLVPAEPPSIARALDRRKQARRWRACGRGLAARASTAVESGVAGERWSTAPTRRVAGGSRDSQVDLDLRRGADRRPAEAGRLRSKSPVGRSPVSATRSSPSTSSPPPCLKRSTSIPSCAAVDSIGASSWNEPR